MRGSEFIVGTLFAQHLLQFLTNPSEILQVSSSWSEDVHVLYTESLNYCLFFFLTFSIFNLDFFASWFRVYSRYLVSATPPTVFN